MPRRAFASLSRQYPIITFFVLAFGFAWMVWIPAGFMEAPAVFVLLGAFAPTGAGLLVTAALEGRSGARAASSRVSCLIYRRPHR